MADYVSPIKKSKAKKQETNSTGYISPFQDADYRTSKNDSYVDPSADLRGASLVKQIEQERKNREQKKQDVQQTAKKSALRKVTDAIGAPGRALANIAYKPLEKQQNRAADLALEQQLTQGIQNTTPSEAADNTRQIKEATDPVGVALRSAAQLPIDVGGGINEIYQHMAHPSTDSGKGVNLQKQTDAQKNISRYSKETQELIKNMKVSPSGYSAVLDAINAPNGKDEIVQKIIRDAEKADKQRNVKIAADSAQAVLLSAGAGELGATKDIATATVPGALKTIGINTTLGSAGNVASLYGGNPDATANEVKNAAISGAEFGGATSAAGAVAGKLKSFAPAISDAEKVAMFNQTAERAKGSLKPLGSSTSVQALQQEKKKLTALKNEHPGSSDIDKTISSVDKKIAEVQKTGEKSVVDVQKIDKQIELINAKKADKGELSNVEKVKLKQLEEQKQATTGTENNTKVQDTNPYKLTATNSTDVTKLSEKDLQGFAKRGYTSITDKFGNTRNIAPVKELGAKKLDSVNPTGGLFVDYDPKPRATMPLADNMTTLDKTSGKAADNMVTIYRGAPSSQKVIQPGDFITTSRELAESYAGTGKVLQKQVRMGDVLDDINEPLGDEYIYRPKQTTLKKVTAEGVQREATPGKPITYKPIKETPTIQTPEIKKSKLASSVQQKAVDKKLTEGFEGLPEYATVNIKQQSKAASNLLNSDLERAKRIATGAERPPEGLLPESVFVAMENYAVENGDTALLRDLATSSLTSEATGMGQRLRVLAERDPDSAVSAIRQVADARKKAIERKLKQSPDKAIKQITKEIKESIKRPTKTDWSMFVESIKC